MPWLRLYSEILDDEKMKLLAFEDRWHYVAILCLKRMGVLDKKGDLRDRMIAAKLGLSLAELDSVKKRLVDVELVDKNLNPKAWDKRQFESDSRAKSQREYRERKAKKEAENGA